MTPDMIVHLVMSLEGIYKRHSVYIYCTKNNTHTLFSDRLLTLKVMKLMTLLSVPFKLTTYTANKPTSAFHGKKYGMLMGYRELLN